MEFTFDVLRLDPWKVPVSLLSHQSQDQDAALWSRSGSVGQGCLFMKRLLSSVGPRDVSLKKSDEKCHCKLHSWSKMYSGQCSGHCSVLLKDKKKELILERLEFCLSLWLPIKRQDQNPLGQKTGELKQKKNTRLILPNI